jgi:hypothetical protein
MELSEPLPWEAEAVNGTRQRWSDEDEAAAWSAATAKLGG